MRTKREITNYLNSLPDTILGGTNTGESFSIFETQIQAAKEVVSYLACNELRTNHVILVAKMQSGKTGTCNAIANLIMNTELKNELAINKVLFITGMNDCGLANQTYERVIEQVTDATKNNTVDRIKNRLPTIEQPKFYVLKNSNLRSFNQNINGTLIFIDESHFGSKELNVLTSFMKERGVDWKNKNSLIANNVYIVSVSATPFDEIVSDVVDCKPMVELQTDDNYVGVTQYFEKELIFPATKKDFDDETVLNYVKDAYNRMLYNNERGVVIVRTRKFDYFNTNPLIKEMFDIFLMDASETKIQYDYLGKCFQRLISENEKINREDIKKINNIQNTPAKIKNITNRVKPLLVLIKGAFRAGITIKPKFKDLIYMVYDFSTDANATAQALLGRMCGYRDLEHCSFNTYFYVNTKFAQMYANWENNFRNKTLIPSSKTKWVWVSNDYIGNDTKLGTKSCGNFVIDNLTNFEVRELIMLSQCSERVNVNAIEEFIKTVLSNHNKNIEYDYFFESYLKGKNTYADSTKERRFEGFSADSVVMQFRPDKCKKFRQDTGRDYLLKEDIGKKGISVVFDGQMEIINGMPKLTGNKRLLIYYFEVGQQKQMANHESLYCVHKDTSILN